MCKTVKKFVEWLENNEHSLSVLSDFIFKLFFAVFIVVILFKISMYFTLLPFGKDLAAANASSSSTEFKVQDFITIATGLFSLIVGAGGLGVYFSFKRILEEEKKISHLREKFEALLIISESSSFDPVTATGDQNAVKIFSAAEKKCRDYGLLYVLRGEQYYYSESFKLAIEDFEKAVKIDPTLARAWYGWGQALFRSESTLENVPKFRTIWNFNSFKNVCNHLKMHEIDRKICPDKAKNSLEKMNRAKNYGYDESKINFEIGRIHEAMQNGGCNNTTFEEILSNYDESYKNGNSDAGLYYCVAWIRKNYNLIVPNDHGNGVDNVIEILINISNTIHKSLVCALLCYIYCLLGDSARAERVFQETNDMAINELFYLEDRNSEGTPCSSSQA